jgi:Leucine-rich repeat (LRR) protein
MNDTPTANHPPVTTVNAVVSRQGPESQMSGSDMPKGNAGLNPENLEEPLMKSDGEAPVGMNKKKMVMAGSAALVLVLIIGVSVGVSSGGHKSKSPSGPAPKPSPSPKPAPGTPTRGPTAMPTMVPRSKCSGNSKCTELNQHCGTDSLCTCDKGFYHWKDANPPGFNCLLTDKQVERDALVELWAKTGHESWSNITNWNSTKHSACDWSNVICNYDGDDKKGYTSKVVELHLKSNKMTGTIPDSLSELKDLKCLDIKSNAISKLPKVFAPSLSKCCHLGTGGKCFDWNSYEGLSVSGNRIRALPESICKLKQLSKLLVDDNLIGGNKTDLPDCLADMDNIKTFSAKNNILENAAVQQLCGLNMVSEVDVSQNPSLNGSIPSCFSTELRFFIAGNCSYTSFPEDMTALKGLQKLFLDNNNISTIPANIGELVGLKTLRLIDNNLHGTLPSGVAKMVELDELFLGPERVDNQIIHKERQIGINRLSGKIPAMPSSLKVLNVRFNDFDGDIR